MDFNRMCIKKVSNNGKTHAKTVTNKMGRMEHGGDRILTELE